MVEFSRLPKSIQPQHYKLTVDPNFVDFTFSGQVEIDLEITDHRDEFIRLNSAEIEVQNASLNNQQAKDG